MTRGANTIPMAIKENTSAHRVRTGSGSPSNIRPSSADQNGDSAMRRSDRAGSSSGIKVRIGCIGSKRAGKWAGGAAYHPSVVYFSGAPGDDRTGASENPDSAVFAATHPSSKGMPKAFRVPTCMRENMWFQRALNSRDGSGVSFIRGMLRGISQRIN